MSVDRNEVRHSLLRLAGSQHGYFTSAQARQVGYSYQAQKFNVDRGNWERVDRALLRLVDWPVSDQDQLVRWTLWSHGAAVVSHESALVEHDLGLSNPARLHLSVPPGFRRVDRAVAIHHASLCREDVEQRDGYTVTTILRALAECADAAIAQENLDEAVDDAMRIGAVTPRQLRDAAARMSPRAELGVERALGALRNAS